ncbi:Cupredoxin superfamily protein [Euphorbia peplus]|nr:Cupredoxin superfamily protein [Euphorbia peplus]
MDRVAIFYLLIASLVGVSMANKNWQYGWGNPAPKHTPHRPVTENKINVGGSSNWTFGFNYGRWAYQHGIFYINDTLVFKYDPPSENNIHPHSVYLLSDWWSFQSCNMTNALKLADESQGEKGFEFKLEKWQPYFFACGGGNGFHCNNGTMKFMVMPQLRRWY